MVPARENGIVHLLSGPRTAIYIPPLLDPEVKGKPSPIATTVPSADKLTEMPKNTAELSVGVGAKIVASST